jgi:hypothetical protein
MRKIILIVLGIALIVFGAVALAKGGIPHTSHHTVNLVIAKGSFDTDEVWAVHPIIAGLSLAAGVLLVFLGAKSK